MKKKYMIPEVSVVNVEPHAHILDGASPLRSVSSNVGLQGGNTGSAEAARVKDQGEVYNVWDDDWSAE